MVENNGNGKVSKYTIMYEETPVVLFDRKADTVTVYESKYLPFAFRNLNPIRPVDAFEWITNRIDNAQRTYMNMVYIARKVGRDRDKMIKDSSGISFTDNFWIKTSDTNHTWSELNSLRDKSRELSLYALTGKMDNPVELLKGHTSLFTTKGFFTKAIIGKNLVKLREDAVLEYPAYLFGKQIGISVAKCELDGDFVNIELFTNDEVSLVHAAELKRYFDTDDEIYNEFVKMGRKDITEQIERMYIFNYLIGNPDMHDENTGVLYDAKTFEFISLAPCYDHNIAFNEHFMGVSHATKGRSSLLTLDDWSKRFIKNHDDIVNKINNVDFGEIKKYIPKERFVEFQARIKELLK
ncbi:MAG: HipA domain-containing protein [Defluviitaleaceae bacterium]|nr:HipA domain-containing protein [Defluviitaleaceae bacterium]